MTREEGADHGVYEINKKDYTVTYGPMVYDIAAYHYLYRANELIMSMMRSIHLIQIHFT